MQTKQKKDSPFKAMQKPKWWLGFFTLMTGSTIQVCCLPFISLTLIACNCSFAIIFN